MFPIIAARPKYRQITAEVDRSLAALATARRSMKEWMDKTLIECGIVPGNYAGFKNEDGDDRFIEIIDIQLFQSRECSTYKLVIDGRLVMGRHNDGAFKLGKVLRLKEGSPFAIFTADKMPLI